MLTTFNKQRVLIAPLDWGLGHATRCIPIIRLLQDFGCEVIIASSGAQQKLLINEFRHLQFLCLKGYEVKYTKVKPLLPLKMVSQIPKIIAAIQYEHRWLDKVIDEQKIDVVISDNRYGLYTHKVPCIFITHQLTIKAPFKWLKAVLQNINYKYINRFTACWVPDVEEENNIAGELSHPLKKPTAPLHYIGLLSRFEKRDDIAEKQYDYCIMLSGPEPQRTILEEMILHDAHKTNKQLFLLRGKPGNTDIINAPENVTVANHLSGEELQQAILKSEYIICRSGYTSVMELLSLQKKAILIPTPGQTEQEYLASRLMYQGWCYSIRQNRFNLLQAIQSAGQFNYQLPDIKGNSLQETMQGFFNEVWKQL